MTSNISEGLTAKSLEHLVLPIISVDEFESKIDDNRCIVVGFYVMDRDPAEDLSTFIDTSSRKVLDTEVSPAPTPDGYYMVFVEFRRNSFFPANLIQILKLIKNLCDINLDRWQMKCIGHDRLLQVNEEEIKENIILDENDLPDIEEKEPEENESKKEEIKEFWKYATVDQIELDESQLVFAKNGQKYAYELVDKSVSGPLNLIETQQANTLQHLLGPSYNVWAIDKYLAVELDNKIQVLKIKNS